MSLLQVIEERREAFKPENKKFNELFRYITTGTAQLVYFYPVAEKIFGKEKSREALCKDVQKIREKLTEMGI